MGESELGRVIQGFDPKPTEVNRETLIDFSGLYNAA